MISGFILICGFDWRRRVRERPPHIDETEPVICLVIDEPGLVFVENPDGKYPY